MAGFLPCALQVGAVLFQYDACLIADNDFLVSTDGCNGMQCQISFFKQGFYGRNILFVNLNHCAQLFIEQCADTGFVDVDLVGNQRGQIYIQATPCSKCHFYQSGKQAAIAAVVVCQEFVFGDKLLNHIVKRF